MGPSWRISVRTSKADELPVLPDLPELKADLQSVLTTYLREQVRRRMPGLNEAPQHLIHEGMTLRVVRADGTVEDSELKSASSEFNIEAAAAGMMTAEERMSKLDALAEDMARQTSQHAFASLNQTLEQAGQVVERAGQPLDADGILQMLDKMQMDFDEHGQPRNISVIVGPQVQFTVDEARDAKCWLSPACSRLQANKSGVHLMLATVRPPASRGGEGGLVHPRLALTQGSPYGGIARHAGSSRSRKTITNPC